MSSSNCCFLTCTQISQEAGQLVWYFLLFKNFQFVVIHRVRGFGIVNKAEVDFSLELSSFLMIQGMLAIWLVSLPFLNPAWTSRTSHFTYCWAWLGEFWALVCQHVRWVQLCSSLSILWHCPSLGLERNLTFPSPVATAGFSKFAGILSAALSQHPLQVRSKVKTLMLVRHKG